FVEESNLAFQVSTLRKALGEGFIETIPKRGYRFRVELEKVDEPQVAASRFPASSRWLLVAAGVLVAGLAAWLLLAGFRTSGQIRTLAVLPFKSPAGMDELGLGLADAMITRLG